MFLCDYTLNKLGILYATLMFLCVDTLNKLGILKDS